ncbi:MAG: YhjD/YihY/BrkB family envelope integrity protein [Acidimicrobiia bacterium]
MRQAVDWVRAFVLRFNQLNGRANAAAITLYGFLALFAITLLAVAVVGFVDADRQNVAENIVSFLGVTGTAAKTVTDAVDRARDTREVASIVGLVGLIWTGSGFALSIATAYDVAWRVPHRATKERLLGLGWLVGFGVVIAVSVYVTSFLERFPIAVAPLVFVAGVAVNTKLWMWTLVLPNRACRGALPPAAIAGGVVLEVLKIAGGIVVPRLVAKSSALYGTIGVVFGLLFGCSSRAGSW